LLDLFTTHRSEEAVRFPDNMQSGIAGTLLTLP
jgi:twinfilin-like protein